MTRAARAGGRARPSPADPPPGPDPHPVVVSVDGTDLHGDLVVPDVPRGVVVFAHGSGSGRHSPRNRAVAGRLHADGFATLLLDLLGDDEAERERAGARRRFDVPRLARRLDAALDVLAERDDVGALPVGLFGASTGAAAALRAAADAPRRVAAVVSRGGRTDLAGDALPRVRCPTRLIVGSEDRTVWDLNERTRDALRCEVDLAIVPGAGHLFEEPGALDRVADLTADWFDAHLPADPAA